MPGAGSGLTPDSAQERIGLPANRVAEVLGLEPIRVDVLELDPFDSIAAPQLDHRLEAMPRIVDEERAFGPDRFELVTLR